MVEDSVARARILVEALPYIQRFSGTTFVIKFGGRAMQTPELRESFARDVVLLKAVGINPVIVHGGGPQITEFITRLGLPSRFVRGLRVTDRESIEVVEMVLQKINKDLVSDIARQGGRAVGLSGKDGSLLTARKMPLLAADEGGANTEVDLGLVGEIERVNPELLHCLEKAAFIPVIAPLAAGRDGQTYNINADPAAGAVAAALGAEKLVLLTDVEGVLDAGSRRIPTLEAVEAERLIAGGLVNQGMIPKVECCLAALRAGVGKAHILDGRLAHAVLLEIFTRLGVGTEVVRAGAASAGRD